MNKWLFPFVFLWACCLFCSCNSNEAIIDRYEQAIAEGDYNKAVDLLYEIDEETLTEEQAMRIADISTGGATKSLMSNYLKLIHESGSYMEDFMSEIEEEFNDQYNEDSFAIDEDDNWD